MVDQPRAPGVAGGTARGHAAALLVALSVTGGPPAWAQDDAPLLLAQAEDAGAEENEEAEADAEAPDGEPRVDVDIFAVGAAAPANWRTCRSPSSIRVTWR